jgi:lipopolysaccharide export LptBFGC system permease protein LptF
MNKRQFSIVLIAVIVSSFFGGIFIQFLNISPPILAKDSKNYFEEIKTKAIYLVGKDDKIRARFYLGIHDTPQLILYDKQDINRFNFGLAAAGNPGMSFINEKLETIINLDTKGGKASITIGDPKGKAIWRAP